MLTVFCTICGAETTFLGAEYADVVRAPVPDNLVRAYKPVPGMPVLRYVPRLPMFTEAPRGPSVILSPDPLKFIRKPGASLIDLLKRKLIALSQSDPRFCFALYMCMRSAQAFGAGAFSL